jgi:cytochrome c-type biogenesis protein CcmF
LLRWKEDKPARLQFELALIASVVIAVIALVTILGDYAILPVLGLALSCALGIGALLPLRGRKLRLVPVATWGMICAHFGVAVALFGMASETAFTEERLAAVAPGSTEEVAGWTITLESVDPVAGPNWTAVEARILASRGGGDPIVLSPQARNFWAPPQATSESALVTRWDGQLYVVIGDQAGVDANGNDRWQLRVWWKPFVTFIWYGGLLIAFGGILSIVGRVSVDLKRRKAVQLGKERREGIEALGNGSGTTPLPEPAE